MMYIKKIIKNALIFARLWKRNKTTLSSDTICEIRDLLDGEKITLVDVGGAVNLQPHHHKLIGNTCFYIFEPDLRSYDDLISTVGRYSHPHDFHYINKALSGKDGKRTLYLSNVPTGSSILPVNKESVLFSEKSTYLFPMKELEIETRNLSTILKEIKVKNFDAIKLDVQGAELEIIQGISPDMLKDIMLIEVEVGLHEIYMNQATFQNTDSFMRQSGFELFELRINRGHIPNSTDNKSYHKIYLDAHEQSPSVSARVYEFDAVYFRSINWVKKEQPPVSIIRKLISLYCVYNFYAEAIQMTEYCRENNLIDEKDSIKIINSIKQIHKKEYKKLTKYHSFLKSNNYNIWAQYMWVPYPSN
ncbi:MAG: FkbM family methyltransferase [Chitinophagaceae bacterium]|nr:FkbM family methyltransferase [Chitinophagaceae bacterium]